MRIFQIVFTSNAGAKNGLALSDCSLTMLFNRDVTLQKTTTFTILAVIMSYSHNSL